MMTAYEYKVIPAPAKGMKVKGAKTPEDRFAHALQELMNQMGAEGWEYQRAETLPSTERAGLTGTTTNWRHVLIFRRNLAEADRAPADTGDVTRGLLIAPPRVPANTPRREPRDPAARPAEPPLTLGPMRADAPEDTESATDIDRDGPASPRKNPGTSDV